MITFGGGRWRDDAQPRVASSDRALVDVRTCVAVAASIVCPPVTRL